MRALLLLLCQGLAGDHARAEFKFLVYGDSRGVTSADPVNDEILGEIAAFTVLENPAFVLFVGDLSLNGTQAHLTAWSNAMQTVYQAGIPIYPIRGNHELFVNLFTAFFDRAIPDNGPPGFVNRTYSFTHQNALFLNLDTSGNHTQPDWVESVLATNTLPHVFVQGHVPAFKLSHPDCLDDYQTERNRLWAALRAAGARAYFCGHDHFYEHARIDDGDGKPHNDIHHFTVATAGAPLVADSVYDGDNGPYTPVRINHNQTFGYLVVRVDGLKVRTHFVGRVSPGVYASNLDATETWTSVTPPRIVPIAQTTDALRLRLENLQPWSRIRLERQQALMSGPWATLLTFTATNSVHEVDIPVSSNTGSFRVVEE